MFLRCRFLNASRQVPSQIKTEYVREYIGDSNRSPYASSSEPVDSTLECHVQSSVELVPVLALPCEAVVTLAEEQCSYFIEKIQIVRATWISRGRIEVRGV